MPSSPLSTRDSYAGDPVMLRQRIANPILVVLLLFLSSFSVKEAYSREQARVPNIVLILADDKYGQGIVNREFLSENKVFYHQSVESALAAI
jgi:hypothetical protein